MSLIGDGLGFRTIRGAGLRITTGAGCMSTAVGVGGLDRLMDTRFIVRFGRRLMFHSSDSAGVSESDLDLASARSVGCRWDLVIFSIPGGAGGAGASATPASANSTAAVLLRCAPVRDFRT